MAGSLACYGQVSPVAVCLREEKPEVLDGFKRVAAKTLPAVLSLQARLVEVDEPTATAIILGLNGIGGRMKELEEAWIVQALVREDGLSQLQVAELLQRHKSWVCRRLALLERLAEECRDNLRLGLLSPTMARQLTRLPAGNQAEVVAAARREHLTAAELHGVVYFIVACTDRSDVEFVLREPRRALRQADVEGVPAWDLRLSAAGNRVLRQLGHLLDGLGRMENWLRHKGRADLATCDRGVLSPGFGRLVDYATYEIDFTEEGRRWVNLFSYVLGYSRRQYLRFVESQDFETTIREHVRAFQYMGGVAATCLYDNMKVVVARYEGDEPIYNTRFLAFATHYGYRVWLAGGGGRRRKVSANAPSTTWRRTSSTAAASATSSISTSAWPSSWRKWPTCGRTGRRSVGPSTCTPRNCRT